MESGCYDRLLNRLPEDLIARNKKFLRWQDSHAHLLGKLLLLEALEPYGFSDNALELIKYNTFSRPYLEGNIDFNISHSSEYVVCAVSEDTPVGIDIEHIKEIPLEDFEKTMSLAEWREINSSVDPMRCFFKYWTIKESIIKAEGSGLSIPLQNIVLRDETRAVCNNQSWYFVNVPLHADYACYLAVNNPHIQIETIEMCFY